MIHSFATKPTEDIYYDNKSKRARNLLPTKLWQLAHRKLDMLDAAVELKDLRSPPGNKLETLKGDRKGQHSIRINDQYRICFTWHKGQAEDIEIVDYH